VIFDGYEGDKPQDTPAEEILFPGWLPCEALYYQVVVVS
jgi:hypothetical protein